MEKPRDLIEVVGLFCSVWSAGFCTLIIRSYSVDLSQLSLLCGADALFQSVFRFDFKIGRGRQPRSQILN